MLKNSARQCSGSLECATAGPDRARKGCVSLVSVTAGPNTASTRKDYPRQSGGRLDSSTVCQDGARKDVDKQVAQVADVAMRRRFISFVNL